MILACLVTSLPALAHPDATGYVRCLVADTQPPPDPDDDTSLVELGLTNSCDFRVVARLCLEGSDGAWSVVGDPVDLAPGQRGAWPDYSNGILTFLGTSCAPGKDCFASSESHNPHCP